MASTSTRREARTSPGHRRVTGADPVLAECLTALSDAPASRRQPGAQPPAAPAEAGGLSAPALAADAASSGGGVHTAIAIATDAAVVAMAASATLLRYPATYFIVCFDIYKRTLKILLVKQRTTPFLKRQPTFIGGPVRTAFFVSSSS